MAELGLYTKQVAQMVAAKYGKQAVSQREVYAILTPGERSFPRPEFVSQIADVLGVPMTDLVIENTCPAPAGELARGRPQPGGGA